MDARTINQTFDLLSLASSHTRLKKSGRYHIGACPFCGGKDRFTLKYTLNGWRWHCRHCGDGNKYYTPIDFVMRLDGVDFKTALQKMGGEVNSIGVAHKPPVKPTSQPVEFPSDDWQMNGLRLVTEWSYQLTASREAQAARDYLTSRGLHYGTWNAWLLGYTVEHGRPAITVPWMDSNGTDERLFAVKYRFIDDLAKDDKGKRFGMLKGSKPVLFGFQHILLGTDDTLLLVEGEFNAMSVWQCMPSRVSVMSMGSQNVSRPEVLRVVADRFKRVFVWMDDATQAASVAKSLQHVNAQALRSPEQDGTKYDANQFLQIGLLPKLMTEKFHTVCYGHVLDNSALV
jgi:hypothetical protein